MGFSSSHELWTSNVVWVFCVFALCLAINVVAY